jgi:electron transfer flavoprotein alpha subunit
MMIGLIETEGDAVSESSLQMLTFARQTAERTGDEMVALILGGAAAALAGTLGRYGVSRIIRVEHERLSDEAPEAWAGAALQVMRDRSPQTVLAAGTDRGNEVMAHLAAKADLPLGVNCSAVAPGDPYRVTRLRWGSSLLEEAVLAGTPKLLTVASHAVAAEEGPAATDPPVETFEPTLTEKDFRVRLVRREAEVTEGITLKNAPVVVGGGRGVGSPEGYAMLETLAGLLGGAVGCSRVATNNGWRPHSDQVGLTGTRISPALYIACGISGAIQHLVGCKGSKRIMVINKDPEAAFFAKADYGVLGDLHEVVPAIIEALEKQR